MPDQVKRVVEQARELGQTAQEQAEKLAQQAQVKTQQIVQQAQELAQHSPEKLRELGQQAQEQIHDLSSQANESVDQAAHTLGDKLADAASLVREQAPSSGPVADLAQQVAGSLESSGSYLKQTKGGASWLGKPLVIAAVGLLVVYLIYRAVSARRG